MKISLIGMSGVGKTYWSKKFQSKGFKRFCCDDFIENNLSSELKHSGIKGVAEWMGQPFSAGYHQASEKYLDAERKGIERFLSAIEKLDPNENIVIDATGSVIYLGKNTLNKLSSITKVIYLDTPAYVKEEMYKLYLQDPKPVIWGNSFKKKGEETNIEALGRCYPKLLAFRIKRYKQLASITIDYDLLHDQNFTIEKFIQVISQ